MEDKKEELRLLVGGSYRDLLSTADQASLAALGSSLPLLRLLFSSLPSNHPTPSRATQRNKPAEPA